MVRSSGRVHWLILALTGPVQNNRIYYGYWLIAAAFVAQFVAIGMYSYVLGSFMTPMIDELGWSRAEFTITRSVGQLVMAAVGIYIGSRVDRFGARPIMLVGTTVLAASLALHAFVDTLVGWIVLNGVVMTVGCAMIGNLVVNVTLSKWFVVNRGKAIAWAAMGVSLGGIVLTPLATWLIDNVGWREAWGWLALFAAVLLYPVTIMMRRAPEDYGLAPDGFSEAQLQAGAGEAADRENQNAFTRTQALRTLSFYGLVFRSDDQSDLGHLDLDRCTGNRFEFRLLFFIVRSRIFLASVGNRILIFLILFLKSVDAAKYGLFFQTHRIPSVTQLFWQCAPAIVDTIVLISVFRQNTFVVAIGTVVI